MGHWEPNCKSAPLNIPVADVNGRTEEFSSPSNGSENGHDGVDNQKSEWFATPKVSMSIFDIIVVGVVFWVIK